MHKVGVSGHINKDDGKPNDQFPSLPFHQSTSPETRGFNKTIHI